MKKLALILAALLFAATPASAVGVWNWTELAPAVGKSSTLTQSTTALYAGRQLVIIGWDGVGGACVENKANTATLFYADSNERTAKPVSNFCERAKRFKRGEETR